MLLKAPRPTMTLLDFLEMQCLKIRAGRLYPFKRMRRVRSHSRASRELRLGKMEMQKSNVSIPVPKTRQWSSPAKSDKNRSRMLEPTASTEALRGTQFFAIEEEPSTFASLNEISTISEPKTGFKHSSCQIALNGLRESMILCLGQVQIDRL